MLFSFFSILLLGLGSSDSVQQRGNDSPPFRVLWTSANNTNNFVKVPMVLPDDAPTLNPSYWGVQNPNKAVMVSEADSRIHQDYVVLNITKHKVNGYYVDLAANDYKFGSNSYVLDLFFAWNGICIEPNPQHFLPILSHRRCALYTNPVSSKNGEIVQFRFANKGDMNLGGLGGIVGNEFNNKGRGHHDVALETTTLTDILDYHKAPAVMDYLSLDVEGAEYHVFQHFAFDRYTFLVMTIERPNHHLHKTLVHHGYRFVQQMNAINGECLYLHKTLPEFEHWVNEYQGKIKPSWDRESKEYLLDTVGSI